MCNLALLALKSKSSNSWPQPMLSPLARHLRTSARAAGSTTPFFVGTMESDAPCVRAVDETDASRGAGTRLPSVKESFTLSLCSSGFSTTAKEGSHFPTVVSLSPQPATKALRTLETSEVTDSDVSERHWA